MKADVTPLPSPIAAPIMPSANLRQRLAEVAGLDVENGLARVRGDEAKYAQVLALFVRGHELDLQKIPEALHCGQTSAAEQLVHALKGTAGLIGATAVAGAAAALLAALQQKAARDEIDKGSAELATRLGQLIDGLKKAQDDEPAIATEAVDTARGAEVLRLLEARLEAGDISAGTLARAETQLLRAVLGDAAAALLAAIEVFDFERALAELRAAKVQRPQPR
jgi:HPt (histidine-containing phosphotransfer) domain-containing protein